MASPAAFGRLCVETIYATYEVKMEMPAAFGRLCVETCAPASARTEYCPAAFGRLCVETVELAEYHKDEVQPPSGGCVLKRPRPR